MLRTIIIFLVLALISGALGFSNIQGMSLDIAKILFFIFIVLFGVSLIMHLFGKKRPPVN